MAVGDLYEVKARWTNALPGAGGSLLVKHYQVDVQGGAITAANVADDVVLNLIEHIVGQLFPDNWGCNQVSVQNLMDSQDFAVTNPGLQGTVTGTALPPVLAIGYRGPFPGRGFHRASCRIPGLVTSDLADNGQWASSAQVPIAAVAPLFGLPLELAGGLLSPCTITPAHTVNGALVPAVFRATAQGPWEYNTTVTTQKSRQAAMSWVQPT